MSSYQLICHMLISLDGRVTGRYLDHPDCQPYIDDYYRILEDFQGNNWICGRATFAEFVPLPADLDLTPYQPAQPLPRVDHIADPAATAFAIALDPSGKLAWPGATIGAEFPQRQGDHVVTILSEAVPDAYLAYLQAKGVSYLFAGQHHQLDVPLLLAKLQQAFGLETFYLLGGGVINGAFAQAEVIDTISLVQAPLIEGHAGERALFELGDTPDEVQSRYRLETAQPLASGALHLTYRKK